MRVAVRPVPFQFYKVRLKLLPLGGHLGGGEFQFYKVRLKPNAI